MLSHSLVDSTTHEHQTNTQKNSQTDRRTHGGATQPPRMAQVASCYREISLPPPYFCLTTPMDKRVDSFLPEAFFPPLVGEMTCVKSLSLSRVGRAPQWIIFIWVSLFFFPSVHPLSAFRGAAVASNPVMALHGVKLIVETQLQGWRGGGRQNTTVLDEHQSTLHPPPPL